MKLAKIYIEKVNYQGIQLLKIVQFDNFLTIEELPYEYFTKYPHCYAGNKISYLQKIRGLYVQTTPDIVLFYNVGEVLNNIDLSAMIKRVKQAGRHLSTILKQKRKQEKAKREYGNIKTFVI